MSTLTTAAAPAGPVAKAGLAQATRSEWTKLRTVRSTPITLIAALVLTVGFGAIACATYAHHIGGMSPGQRTKELAGDDFDPVSFSLVGVMLAQVALAVLGVLAISSEFGSGLIRTTLTAVPGRGKLLGAKTIAFGTLVVVTGQAVAFPAYAVGQMLFAGQHLDISPGADGVVRAVTGTGAYLALVALMGLAMGTVVRHTAGAITALIMLLLVIGPLTSILPGGWGQRVHRFMPDVIGTQASSLHPKAADFGPVAGLGLMALYVVVLLVAGGWLLRRRDA